MSEDFKLRLYFSIYKDYPIASRDSFRLMFTRKHGYYHYLPELIHRIEQYQYEKYGMMIWHNKGLYSFKKNNKRR